MENQSGEELAAAFDAACQFGITGKLVGLVPLVRGHTNASYVATFENAGEVRRFVLQRLNSHAFEDIPGLMGNVEAVIGHLARAAKRSAYDVLELVHTSKGATWLNSEFGDWRCFKFMEGTTCFDRCESTEQAFEVAQLVGWFQTSLNDLDTSKLKNVTPDFFSPTARLDQFERAIATMLATTDGAGLRDLRLKETMREALGLCDLAERFGMHLHRGDFPSKVIHGDTKLNNVLFSESTGKPRALVDLDTVMPGYRLYDFGDLVRTAAATSAEDEPDETKAGINPAIHEALLEGYLETTGATLNKMERELLPLSGALVSYIVGLRFLTDHLSGDIYFGASHPGQNLDRARVQFAQVRALS